MDREVFVEQLNFMQSFNTKIDQLKDLGIDLINSDLYELPAKMFDNFIYSICTEEGSDLVFWWLYEDVEKVLIENDKKITLNTVYQLYDYLTENKLFNF